HPAAGGRRGRAGRDGTGAARVRPKLKAFLADTMNKCTAFFLILLRLAIGWHFFAEGYHKLEGYWHGPTETVVGKSKPFTSAAYLREGSGPLAKIIRQQIGDPDEEALALLTTANGKTPTLLAKEWGDYVHRFGDYYGLNDEQRKKAEEALTKTEDAVV